MSRARNTPAAAPPVPPMMPDVPEQQPGLFAGDTLLRKLMIKATPHLSTAELRWVSHEAAFHAAALARRSRVVADGIGMLVGWDGSEGGGGAGSFQHADDVPDLLFHFAGVFDYIAGLTSVAAEASQTLHDRSAE